MASFERTEVELVSGWMAIGAMQGKTEPFDEFRSEPSTNPSPCRDFFRIYADESLPTLLFAVADGVSCSPHSDVGARVAVDAAIELMQELNTTSLLSEGGLRMAMSAAHQKLNARAVRTGWEPHDLATTLIIGVVDRDSGRLACMAIGDGYVLARNADKPTTDWWFPSKVRLDPQGGVHSLTDAKWEQATHFEICPFPVATAIAVTDGLKRLAVEYVPRPDGTSTPRASSHGIDLVVKAILEGNSVSRTRDLSNLLGFRKSLSLMGDDRTIVVMQRLIGFNGGAVFIPPPQPPSPLEPLPSRAPEPVPPELAPPPPPTAQSPVPMAPWQPDPPAESAPDPSPWGPRLKILAAIVAGLTVILAGNAAWTNRERLALWLYPTPIAQRPSVPLALPPVVVTTEHPPGAVTPPATLAPSAPTPVVARNNALRPAIKLVPVSKITPNDRATQAAETQAPATLAPTTTLTPQPGPAPVPQALPPTEPTAMPAPPPSDKMDPDPAKRDQTPTDPAP